LTPGDIVLLKKDSVSDELLSGAVFDLTDSAGAVLQQGLTSDGDGCVTIENLIPGDYRFVETQAPFGYDLDATPIPFTIAKGQSEPLQIAMTNTLTPGGVILTKVDSVSEVGLPDAVFSLEDSTGTVLQQDLTTDENGCIYVENLIPGDYRFVETQAPFGYELDSTPILFTIEKGQAEPLRLTMTNTLTPSDVVLTKKDSTGSKVLSGAVFELQDGAGVVLRQGLVTNGNGCIIVEDLAPGDYRFVEKQAPAGYVLDATPVKFTIERGQTEFSEVTVKNTLMTVAPLASEFSAPETGDTLDILIPIVLLIAALAMFGAVRTLKKRPNR
ncbi:MAG: collagen binding domain-containing protein, partial [Actinobacteria bacterium]|nr:collagen binding domain-containing protein [Actinomycetota bacterium]